jgi:hypothetical protein
MAILAFLAIFPLFLSVSKVEERHFQGRESEKVF